MARREERAIWSRLAVAAVLLLAVAPTLPLLMTALVRPPDHPVWTRSFATAIFGSARVGVGIAGLSVAVGLPLGILAALYRFPGRSPLVAAQALPLLLPSFLPAIGWSNLAATGRLPDFLSPVGGAGSVFVLGFQAIPLVFFATWAATGTLTASEIDAARLGGGEKAVLGCSAAACIPVAVLTALLAGILGLSDPGAPLILGGRSAVVEIRTTFSALYDYDLAGRQCLALGGLVLLVAAPIVIVGLGQLAAAVLARQTRVRAAYAHPVFGPVALAALVLVLSVGIVMPTLGLCLPVIDRPMAARALEKAWDTAGSTFAYTAGAGSIAVLLAIGLALATRNKPRLRSVVLGVLLTLLAMPAALGAIGVSRAAAKAPPELDWLVRSRFTVAAVLGLSGSNLARPMLRARVEEALAMCGIEDLADRRPGTLSGGQQQRVALARALAGRPKLLLLDEPFGGLDLLTKEAVVGQLVKLRSRLNFALILVTHDPAEVRALCNQLAVLEDGRIVEHGALIDVAENPRTPLATALTERWEQQRG